MNTWDNIHPRQRALMGLAFKTLYLRLQKINNNNFDKEEELLSILEEFSRLENMTDEEFEEKEVK